MIDAYWSGFFDVPASALREPGITVTPHSGLGDYRGVWFFVRGSSAIVSAPAESIARLAPRCRQIEAQELLTPALATRIVGPAAGEILGPSFQGWLRGAPSCSASVDGVRRLTRDTEAAISAIRSSCTATEWEHGGISPAGPEVWASFEADQPVALCQLRRRAGGAVDPCVITHPAHRGRGHALRVVGAMAAEARSAGTLILYQTLLANRPAMSIARRLGFEHYATLLTVRLRP